MNETDQFQKILLLAKEKKPKTVQQLTEHIMLEFDVSEDIALDYIIELENRGALQFHKQPLQPSRIHLFFSHLSWFWFIILISISALLSSFYISGSSYPFSYLRFVFGTMFIIFLPGYSLMKALYPEKNLKNFESVSLIIGFSIVIVPLVGLLLMKLSFKFELESIFISLLITTFGLSIIGLIRQYRHIG